MHIYITILNYITNSPTSFGASAPSSGNCDILFVTAINCRSQWPCGLRCRSEAASLMRLWVRIPPGGWMFVCCESCVLSGRGLCNGLITHPEESTDCGASLCVI